MGAERTFVRDTTAADRYRRNIAPFARPFAEHVVSGLELRPGQVVIDHGAGTGLVTRMVLARHPGVSVVAVDPSHALLQGLGTPSGVRVVHGTAVDVPVATGAHAVLSNLVLMFCPDPVADLAALRQACRPGAMLRASVLGAAAEVVPFAVFWSIVHEMIPGAWEPSRYPHHRLHDPAHLASIATQAGWSSVSVRTVAGHRRISAAGAWRWLSSALPVGADAFDGAPARYAALSAGERSTVRAEFMRRWARHAARVDFGGRLLTAIA